MVEVVDEIDVCVDCLFAIANDDMPEVAFLLEKADLGSWSAWRAACQMVRPLQIRQ